MGLLNSIKNLLTVGSLLKIRLLSINKDTWSFYFEDIEGVLVHRKWTREGLAVQLKSKIMGIIINYHINLQSPNVIGVFVLKRSVTKVKNKFLLKENG